LDSELKYGIIVKHVKEWIAGISLAIFFMNQIGWKCAAGVGDHFPSFVANNVDLEQI
jgi:hypothetical protein